MSTDTSPISRIRQLLKRSRYVLTGASAFLLVLCIWQWLCAKKIVPVFFLPSPGDVLVAGKQLFTEYALLADIKASFYRVSVGFLIAAALAVPLGVLMGAFKIVEAFVEPLNDFIRYMPVPAFIPLTILWIGIGDASQIAIIFIGTFFQLTIMVMDVVHQVPRDYLEASYTLGYGRLGILYRVVIPASLPGIFDALRISVGWAWSYVILAEVVAANVGLGHMIMDSQRYVRTANVIAGILIIGMIGLTIDTLFKLAYRLLFRWNEKKTFE